MKPEQIMKPEAVEEMTISNWVKGLNIDTGDSEKDYNILRSQGYDIEIVYKGLEPEKEWETKTHVSMKLVQYLITGEKVVVQSKEFKFTITADIINKII